MRAAFLVHDLSPSGGVATIRSYGRALRERGHEVDLLTSDDWRAARDPYDCVVATWWETAAGLYEVPARRRVAFLQSFEERFYGPDRPLDREGAAAVLELPLDYVVVAAWMRDVLAELRPDARCLVVRNGIDKAVFTACDRGGRSGPLRVLVEGQPTLWFKGVADALAATEAMTEPRHVTLAALDPAEAAGAAVDRVVGGLDAAAMADLYGESDVLLKLSRVEGLGLPPLEGFHTGLPCVVTPFGGHADYVEHARNGAVVGFDDPAGTARWLDALAADRGLLERLSAGALETAAGWPSADDAGQEFAAALEELADGPADEVDPAVPRLLRRMRATRTVAIHESAGADSALAETRAELAHAQSLVHELSVKYQQCARALERARGPLRRLARRLFGRVGG
jgi:glycosyltransferase involved in cell wall biosynthesis